MPILFGLIVYDVILAFGLMATKRDEIVGFGKEVISSSVEFTTTAVFEGFGKTSDYFEEKWEVKYLNELNKVDIILIAQEVKTYSDHRELITLDIEFKNESEEDLYLNSISEHSYILITMDNSTYYPLEFANNQSYSAIPKGLSRLIMTGLVPLEFKAVSMKIGDKTVEL